MTVAKSIQLLSIQRKHRQPLLQQRIDNDTARDF